MRPTGWRYAPRKMVVQVTAAVCLVIAANWMPPGAQAIAREAGWGAVAIALGRWLARQGKRQPKANGNGDQG